MDVDYKILLDILNELNWDGRIGNLSQVVITVKNGTVTIAGWLAHRIDQQLILEAVKQVAGVKRVVEERC